MADFNKQTRERELVVLSEDSHPHVLVMRDMDRQWRNTKHYDALVEDFVGRIKHDFKSEIERMRSWKDFLRSRPKRAVIYGYQKSEDGAETAHVECEMLKNFAPAGRFTINRIGPKTDDKAPKG